LFAPGGAREGGIELLQQRLSVLLDPGPLLQRGLELLCGQCGLLLQRLHAQSPVVARAARLIERELGLFALAQLRAQLCLALFDLLQRDLHCCQLLRQPGLVLVGGERGAVGLPLVRLPG